MCRVSNIAFGDFNVDNMKVILTGVHSTCDNDLQNGYEKVKTQGRRTFNMLTNVREYRMNNEKGTIQIKWQHRVHKTQDKDEAKPQHYTSWTTLYANKTMRPPANNWK